MKKSTVLVVASLLLLPAAAGLAQLSSSVTEVTPAEAGAGAPVSLTVTLQQGHRATSILLLYRPFGSSSYRKAEMDLRGSTARFTIPADYILPPFVEYYLVLTDEAGTSEAYPRTTGTDPLRSPPLQPLRLMVGKNEEPQVLFLSPDPGAVVDPDDILISLSLLRADSTVVRRATQVKLDDINVTASAVFSEELIVIVPSNQGLRLSPGPHTIKVGLFNRKGEVQATAELTFSVRGSAAGLLQSAQPVRGFDYNLNVQVESRNENIRDEGTWYNRAGATFRGKTGIWTINSNLFLTSDERSDRQPQHRFFLGVQTPWVQAGYGDHYPTLPELILNGKRVRGLQASARYGIFGMDLSLGQISRAIDGRLLKSFPADSVSVEFRKDSTAAFGRVDSITWGKFGYGTYARNLFAIRPNIGNHETWEVGFSWLSAGDDVGSIAYGLRPKENIVFGSDFVARFDDRRIEVSGQAALSAYNSDISSGTFTDAYVDSVYPNDASGIKTARDYLKRLITVNDNFRPLSAQTFSTLAYEVGVGLNYFDNSLKFTYLYRGNDYTSFGQSFLQTDIRGFTLVDRARIIDNQVFLTLGFERLSDNTNGTKPATTDFTNMNIAASYLPRRDLPTITVGFSHYGNDNGLQVSGADSLTAVNDGTNRIYLQSSYNFLFGARHTARLNVSTSNRSDESIRRYDVKNVTLEIGLTTLYTIPLRTVFNLGIFRNTLPAGTLRGESRYVNYTVLTLGSRYTVIAGILTLGATVAPTFGDYKRIVLDFGSEWTARPDMSLLFQLTFFKNDGVPDERIVSLRYRYTI